MVAAVALFTAVSCNKEIEQDNLPAGETVVYTASTDAQTKAALNETTKKSEWVANDAITVHDGTKGWTFTTAGSGANADFVNSEGFGDYRPVMAVYPAGEWSADVNTKTVSAAIPADQQAQLGTYHSPAALAVAYSENNSFAFRNAHALLKFTVNADNVTHVIFHGNQEEKITGKVSVELGDEGVSVTGMDMTYAKCYAWHDADNKYFLKGEGNTYYMAVAPQTFNKGVTVKIQVNEGEEIVVKTTEKPVETKVNTILDLGELTYEVPVAEWAIAGTFNEWSTTATPMTLEGDYYVARKVSGLNFTANSDPENKSSDTGIKFVNKGTVWKGGYGDTDTPGKLSVNSWSWYWEDGGVNVYVDGASAETEYDIYLNPSNGKFVIVAAGAAMPEDKPATAQEWYLVGAFNSWTAADPDYKMTLDGDWYVFKNFTADGYGVKFVADGAWTINRGGSFIANQAIEVAQDGSDMSVPAGKYDVYLSADAATAYFMNPGLLPGEAPEPEGIYAEEGWVYLKPNSNWTQAGARFAIYFFGNGETWVSMTKVDGTNYYGVKISDIISKGYTGMILCRMNPGAAANNWNNKWNQSGDLKVSDFTSGKNCFTVPNGSWDGATAGWSTVDKLN